MAGSCASHEDVSVDISFGVRDDVRSRERGNASVATLYD